MPLQLNIFLVGAVDKLESTVDTAAGDIDLNRLGILHIDSLARKQQSRAKARNMEVRRGVAETLIREIPGRLDLQVYYISKRTRQCGRLTSKKPAMAEFQVTTPATPADAAVGREMTR